MMEATEGDVVSIDFLFDRTREEFSLSDGWLDIVHPDSDVKMQYRIVSEKILIVAITRNTVVSADLLATVARPEFAFSLETAAIFGGDVHGQDVEEVVTPGDVVAWRRWADTKQIKENVARLCSKKAETDVSFEEGWDGRFFFRCALRRDFPSPGSHTVVTTPWCRKRCGATDEEMGSQKVYATVISPSATEEGKCQAFLTFRCNTCDPEMLPVAASPFVKWTEIFSSLTRETIEPLIQADMALYVTVALKKCQKGPPLLPSNEDPGSGIGWQACEWDGFTLPSYLNELMYRLGVTATAYDRIDGMLVAPYQAVFSSTSWETAQDALSEAFADQRTAYRRIYGGTGGPVLVLSADTKYLKPSEVSVGSGSAYPRDPVIPVRNTFLDFREGRTKYRRSDSM